VTGVATAADPAVVGDGAPAAGSTVDDVELDEVDEEDDVEATGGGDVSTGGRNVVTGDWVATCCLVELSVPVATSNSRATRATEARP
jgi:hypothetical protein